MLAGAFRLLDGGSVRPGADAYTDQHGTYGITTLRCSHGTVRGGTAVELRFPGKSGHKWSLVLDEPSLAALVSGLKTRGRAARLFAWRDDEGLWHALAPAEINAYVRERTGGDFTAKDFRTLAGTAAAAMSLAKAGSMVSEASRKRAVTTAMRDAADALGNTAAIARKSYVDPRVVALFERGKTLDGGDRRAVETRLLELLT